MKKITFILYVTILFISISLNGQDNFEYGKITQEEFDMKSYPKDKNADAVVLFDIGKSHFEQTESGFKVVYERHTRIKILSNSGVKWSEIDIPYYQQGTIFEEIKDLEGITYNFDEKTYVKKSDLNVKNSFDEKINNNWKQKRFAMPDTKEGSIIEYRYKIYSEYMFNLRDWEFQWEIPVIYSKYIVGMIPFYEYTWLFQGSSKFDEKKTYVDTWEHRIGGVTYKNNFYEFVMKNVPAFNDEDFITSKNDFIMKIDFQLSRVNHIGGGYEDVMTTWEGLNKELISSKEFGNYISKSEKLGQKNSEVQEFKSLANDKKFNSIIDYVKNNYKWNGYNDKFASKTPADFEKQKTGNSADINLYTIGLLRSVGIQANPVLISTRSHGKVKYDYPYLNFFNYVAIIANVDSKNIISDATDDMCLNNRVPERCINNKGLIVEKDQANWVSMETLSPSNNNTIVVCSFDQTNTIQANITKVGTEYEALKFKSMFGEEVKKIKDNYKSQTYEIVDSTLKIGDIKNTNKSYAFSFNVTSTPELINNKMYINPFLGLNLSENPLKKSERTYPIDMIYPKRTTFTSIIKVPKEWVVDYLPETSKVENDLFSLDYNIVSADGEINISFSYYFKKSIYPENNYLLMKSYFNDIISKGNDRIVLSKK